MTIFFVFLSGHFLSDKYECHTKHSKGRRLCKSTAKIAAKIYVLYPSPSSSSRNAPNMFVFLHRAQKRPGTWHVCVSVSDIDAIKIHPSPVRSRRIIPVVCAALRGIFRPEHNKICLSSSLPSHHPRHLPPTTAVAFPSFLPASPSAFRPFPSALILLLFVPNRVTRPRCPTDRPRRLLYLYSGLRVLRERTCPPRSTRRERDTYPSFAQRRAAENSLANGRRWPNGGAT